MYTTHKIDKVTKEHEDKIISLRNSGTLTVNNEYILLFIPLILSEATSLLSRLKTNILEASDLLTTGLDGLMHAISVFDSDKNASIWTYARHNVRKNMRNEIAILCAPVSVTAKILSNPKNKKIYSRADISIVLDTSKNSDTPYTIYADKEQYNASNKALELISNKLPSADYAIIRDRFVHNMTYADLACKYNISKMGAYKKVLKILKKTRKFLKIGG